MAKYINKKEKDSISYVVAIILIIGLIAGLMSFSNKADENGRIKISPDFKVGGLTSYGKYLETEEEIYTENAFPCKGLEVNLKFESNITYCIYFYDANQSFISNTGELGTSFAEEIAENACYARIVISPQWSSSTLEEDKRIAWYSVRKYANQIEIKVFENQSEKE